MLTVCPHYEDKSVAREIIFMLDRSDSMADQIESVKEALQVFLRSLYMGTKFNIVSFGSDFEFMFPKSVPLTQKSLNQASRAIIPMKANMGKADSDSVMYNERLTIVRWHEDAPTDQAPVQSTN